MNLNEAIKRCEEVVEEKNKETCNLYDAKNYEESRECIWCAEEHKQLAEWLKELKQYREQWICKNAISRVEALKAVYDMDIPEDMSVFEIKSHIGVAIDTLPPVQPKPKTGHWIDADGDNAICSCCNRLNHLYGTYCKYCGSKND